MTSRSHARPARQAGGSREQIHLTHRAFARLVEQALEELPDDFAKVFENVAVVVEDEPPPETLEDLGFEPGDELFGLYEGVPLPERDSFYQSLPDRISIYRGPLQRACRSRREIVQEIRDTVVHEIGHYFGLSDEEMPY